MSGAARILFLYSSLAVGGAERQLALLVPALRDRGFKPVVATLRARGRYFSELDSQDVTTVFVDMRSRTDLSGARRAYALWRLRPNVVVSSSLDAQVLGQAIARRAGAAHVTIEHAGPGLPRRRHQRVLGMLVARAVDRAVAVSPSQTAELTGLGYDPERISIVPNGIPRPLPLRSRDDVRVEAGLEAGDVIFLLAATLRPEKRAWWFAEAVVKAHARDPRVRGLIAGAGPELERVAAVARAHPGALGVLGERDDIPDLIAASDAVCLASTYEALPMIALEAMALGKPVLATRVGGLPEVVTPGVTGELVPSTDQDRYVDAIVALAAEDGRRSIMGSAAEAAYEERFTLERMVAGYETLLAAAAG